ncbi:hypothetical protein P4O66_012624 [Electrophorus voltai]|uniref:C-type lectin domain-containing protein n=1 Tax=Electrophorus voltai TaxID=2609070 RepID=A0AAD9DV17_9TELE|nr:hypothetical protein P4O66_012624 [Electrophorus voltai]
MVLISAAASSSLRREASPYHEALFHHRISLSLRYYLIQQETTWSAARAYYRASYGDLVTMESNSDVANLKNAEQSYFTSDTWIGMYNDITIWHWSLGNVPLGIMAAWALLQPDNIRGEELCGMIMKLGVWFDESYAEKKSFMHFSREEQRIICYGI